jgi:hypothetical protein
LLANLLADLLMADAGVIDLDTGAVVEKRGRGRPRGSKNKPKDVSMVASSSSAPMKRRPGRPLGSKNKPKPSSSLANRSVDSNAAHHNASPPPPINLFSFFAIAGAQCREQQRVPLKFTPYEVEVYYDGRGEMFFRGGWPQFAEDHDLHQGFFMLFNYHCGTPKFDVKIFDGKQCQNKY